MEPLRKSKRSWTNMVSPERYISLTGKVSVLLDQKRLKTPEKVMPSMLGLLMQMIEYQATLIIHNH